MRFSNTTTKYFGKNETLSSYCNSIRRFKELTPEEEQDLILKYKETGDVRYRNEIMNANQRFILKMAKVYAKDENDVLDYIDEGNIGMNLAFEKYDPSVGTRFLTFAVWYIQRSMNYYLENKKEMVIRSNNMKLAKKIEKVKQVYYAENGYLPNDDEVVSLIKEKYDIDIKDVRDVYDVNVSSINEELNDDFTVEEDSDYNQKTASDNLYEEDIVKESNTQSVNNILATLSERDAKLLRMSFNIGGEYTIEDISRELNMYPKDIIEQRKKLITYLQQNSSEYLKMIA